MNALIGDIKAIQLGLKHYVLADLFLAPFFGLMYGMVVILGIGYTASTLHIGLTIIAESLITWLAVLISSSIVSPKKRGSQVALIATFLSGLTTILSIPYSLHFASLAQVPVGTVLIRDALHLILFYTASAIHFRESK